MGTEEKPNGSPLAWRFHPGEDVRLREGGQQTQVICTVPQVYLSTVGFSG